MTTGELSTLPQQDKACAYPAHRNPIDEAVLADLIQSIGADAAEAQIEIFNLFFESTPAILEKICQGARLGDWDQVRANLHALRGSCELFGATHLTQQCRVLGKMLADGQTAQAPALVEEIRAEYQRVVADLQLRQPARGQAFPPPERASGVTS